VSFVPLKQQRAIICGMLNATIIFDWQCRHTLPGVLEQDQTTHLFDADHCQAFPLLIGSSLPLLQTPWKHED